MSSYVLDTLSDAEHAANKVPKPGKIKFKMAQTQAIGFDTRGTFVISSHTYRSTSSIGSSLVLK